jgi:hypothetical protein
MVSPCSPVITPFPRVKSQAELFKILRRRKTIPAPTTATIAAALSTTTRHFLFLLRYKMNIFLIAIPFFS